MGVRKFRCDEQSKFGIESDHLIVKLDHHLITCVAYINVDVITFTRTHIHLHFMLGTWRQRNAFISRVFQREMGTKRREVLFVSN